MPMPYFIDAKSRSFGIFDGVGSIKNSAEAARIAASTAEDYLSSESFRQPYDLGKHAVKSALMAAHESMDGTGLNSETTAVVAKFYETPSGPKVQQLRMRAIAALIVCRVLGPKRLITERIMPR